MRAVLILLPLLALAWPSAAEACSLAFDWADPPAQEQPYDQTQAPAPPDVTAASVYHYRDQSSGCGAVATCGDYSVLTIELAAQPAHERVRVTYEDGSVEYGLPRAAPEGTASFALPWTLNRGQPGPITLEVVDDQGYPSAPVEITPTADGDPAGCSIGHASDRTGGMAAGTLLCLAALLLLQRRRRA